MSGVITFLSFRRGLFQGEVVEFCYWSAVNRLANVWFVVALVSCMGMRI